MGEVCVCVCEDVEENCMREREREGSTAHVF